jgi:hypothetical protein
MKTERRHELQTNELADWIGHQFEHVKPHGKTILAASILGTAVVCVAFVLFKDRESARESAWIEFNVAYSARDSAALAEVANRHPGTQVALLARQAQADLDLGRGISSLYTNRDDALFALSDARRAYTEVIAGSLSYPDIQRHALFGLAQAHEASSNLDEAKDYYQQVASRYSDSAMGREAEARLDALKNPETAKWYAWFSRQKPKPSSPLSGGGANIPGLQGNLLDLPDRPDLPPAPEGTPLSTPKDVETPPADSKQGDDVPPASATPSANGPPSSAPPASDPPAGTPPATESPAPASPETPKSDSKSPDAGQEPKKE